MPAAPTPGHLAAPGAAEYPVYRQAGRSSSSKAVPTADRGRGVGPRGLDVDMPAPVTAFAHQ